MIWLRRGLVFVLSVVLLVCLVAGVAAIGLNRGLGQPDKLKVWLKDSKAYDNFVDSTLSQSQKSGEVNNVSGSVSLSDPQVKQAAEAAFTPELLQKSADAFIDSNYAWLTGKTATPDFVIDLSGAKQNFAKQVGQTAQTRLASLPVCTPAQIAQIPIPANPLSVSCRPAILDPKTEGPRLTQEINDNDDFLARPVITAASLGQAEGRSQGQPYYKKFSWAPKAYKFGVKAPWILGGVALLSALGIVFLAPRKRRGARRVGVVLALSGLILIAAKSATDTLTNQLEAKISAGQLANQLKQPLSDLLHKIEPQFGQVALWFGIVYLVMALAIFIFLFKTREGRPVKPKQTISPQTGAAAPTADAISNRLAPRRPRTSTGLTDLRPKPAETPPPAKKPRPRKPRPLVQ